MNNYLKYVSLINRLVLLFVVLCFASLYAGQLKRWTITIIIIKVNDNPFFALTSRNHCDFMSLTLLSFHAISINWWLQKCSLQKQCMYPVLYIFFLIVNIYWHCQYWHSNVDAMVICAYFKCKCRSLYFHNFQYKLSM